MQHLHSRKGETAAGSHASAERVHVDALLREYARTRDLALRNRLVKLHERLVRYLASRFPPGNAASTEDLIQVGYVGLIAALERFEPGKGISFPTFATPTIIGHIKHYLRDHTWGVKAPRRLRELGLRLRGIRARLEQEMGRPPTLAEMAEAAGVNEEALLEAMELARARQAVSLDAHVQLEDSESQPSFWDAIGRTDPEMAAVEERETLRSAMDHLAPRERVILYERFFREASQSEVAQRLGVSQMHVSRLERAAIRRLRELLE